MRDVKSTWPTFSGNRNVGDVEFTTPEAMDPGGSMGNRPEFAAMSCTTTSASVIQGDPVTTTDDRQGKTTLDLLPFLPLALIITVFGVAVFIAQVAPSRVTSGVYQVNVGEGPAQFSIATESLTCSRIGDSATCTAPVAGRQLTIDIEYRGFDLPVKESTCTARHGDRPVPCMSMLGGYGHASNSVSISDPLGVTEPELTRLRDAVPWWRTGGEPIAESALLCALAGVAAGVTAYLLSKRTRLQAAEWRFPIAIGTGVLGLVLFAAGGLMIASGDRIVVGLLTAPGSPVWLASAMLMAWQYQLGGAGGHGRGRRWAYAIGAAIVTAFYIAAAMFVFLLYSGFID